MAPKKKSSEKAGKAPSVQKKQQKRASAASKPSPKKSTKAAQESAPVEASADPHGIVIEACKQCNAFKTRALKLESLLKEEKPDLEVTINPVKPRRGYFEVRNGDSGEQYVSLPEMKRPFPPLKALDIDDLAKEVLAKLDKA